ncbi:hypothetical protein LJC55_03130 [Eubacteriales bacterium OttesenSCG-928-N14]|nr:hypothetical protein [Eubacteriales bacterium OttesenSCG-928-N14]
MKQRSVLCLLCLTCLLCLCACGDNAGTATPSPSPTASDAANNGDTAAHIAQVYEQQREAFTAYMRETTPDYVMEIDPVFYFESPQRGLYFPISLGWVRDVNEDQTQVTLGARYDPESLTLIIVNLSDSQELPWLTVITPTDGTTGSAVISVNHEAIVTHTPEYFETYMKNYQNANVHVDGQAEVMTFNCCQGGRVNYSGNINGVDVVGTYAIYGNELGCYQFCLFTTEEYYTYAREDFDFFFTNSGHFFQSQEEFDAVNAMLETRAPKR